MTALRFEPVSWLADLDDGRGRLRARSAWEFGVWPKNGLGGQRDPSPINGQTTRNGRADGCAMIRTASAATRRA